MTSTHEPLALSLFPPAPRQDPVGLGPPRRRRMGIPWGIAADPETARAARLATADRLAVACDLRRIGYRPGMST